MNSTSSSYVACLCLRQNTRVLRLLGVSGGREKTPIIDAYVYSATYSDQFSFIDSDTQLCPTYPMLQHEGIVFERTVD